MAQHYQPQPDSARTAGVNTAHSFSWGLVYGALLLTAVCALLLDYPLAQFISAHYSERVRFTFWVLGRFGRAELWSVVALILILMPRLSSWFSLKYDAMRLKRAQLNGLYLALTLAISSIAIWVVKIGVGRPRPALFVEQGVWRPEFFQFSNELVSFPSGHSQVVWVGAFWLSRVFPRFRWYFLLLAPIPCLGRVINLRHYPSDVVAGATIAILCALAIEHFFPKLKPR